MIADRSQLFCTGPSRTFASKRYRKLFILTPKLRGVTFRYFFIESNSGLQTEHFFYLESKIRRKMTIMNTWLDVFENIILQGWEHHFLFEIKHFMR